MAQGSGHQLTTQWSLCLLALIVVQRRHPPFPRLWLTRPYHDQMYMFNEFCTLHFLIKINRTWINPGVKYTIIVGDQLLINYCRFIISNSFNHSF